MHSINYLLRRNYDNRSEYYEIIKKIIKTLGFKLIFLCRNCRFLLVFCGELHIGHFYNMLLLHTELMVSSKISFSDSLGLEHEISVSSIHNLSRDPNLSSEVGSPPSPPISLTGASANGCQSNLLCVVCNKKKGNCCKSHCTILAF